MRAIRVEAWAMPVLQHMYLWTGEGRAARAGSKHRCYHIRAAGRARGRDHTADTHKHSSLAPSADK